MSKAETPSLLEILSCSGRVHCREGQCGREKLGDVTHIDLQISDIYVHDWLVPEVLST